MEPVQQDSLEAVPRNSLEGPPVHRDSLEGPPRLIGSSPTRFTGSQSNKGHWKQSNNLLEAVQRLIGSSSRRLSRNSPTKFTGQSNKTLWKQSNNLLEAVQQGSLEEILQD